MWTVAAKQGLLCPSMPHNSAPEGESLSVSSVPEIEQLKMNSTHTASTFARLLSVLQGARRLGRFVWYKVSFQKF